MSDKLSEEELESIIERAPRVYQNPEVDTELRGAYLNLEIAARTVQLYEQRIRLVNNLLEE